MHRGSIKRSLSIEGIPIRIAFFSKQLPLDSPNGVSWQVHRLANALVRLGHEVTCFAGGGTPPDALYRHEKLEFGSRKSIISKFLPAFIFSRIPTNSFDIVHYHGDDYLSKGSHTRVRTFYGSAFFEACSATKLSRVAYQSLFYFFELISAFKKGHCVGISRITARVLPRISTIIDCGIDSAEYARNPIKTTEPSIVALGELYGRKRTIDVIHAFLTRVLPLFPTARLTVVGPLRYDHPSVDWFPFLSQAEMAALFSRSWLYCCASTYEGFGVPLIEAMAAGTIVVCIATKMPAEFLEHEKNALICSRKSLGACITRVFRDPALMHTIRENGAKTEVHYSIDAKALKYQELYQQIHAGRI